MISKEDLIKIIVIVVALVFLLEVFSFQGSSRNLNSRTTPNESPTPAGAGEIGSAEVDAVVSSYPDGVITITGSRVSEDATLLARLRALASDGKIAYFNSANSDNVNVVLSTGANITEIGRNLSREFPAYRIYSKAQLTLPDEIAFTTARGVVSAPVRFKAGVMMEPIIAEGDKISVFITALLVKGAVSEMQVELAEKEGITLVLGKITQFDDYWVADAEIPWENRTKINESALKDVLAAVYPNSTVSYEVLSFISFGNTSEEKQAELRNLSYVLFTVEGHAVVEEDFVNKSMAEEDFHRILGSNTSLEFPPSALKVNVSAASFNESIFREIIGVESVRIRRRGTFELGEVVSVEGKDYFLPNGAHLSRLFPSNTSVGDQLTQPVRIKIKGGKVTLIE